MLETFMGTSTVRVDEIMAHVPVAQAGIDVATEDFPGKNGNLLQKRLFDAGLHIKTTGDAALISPPLVVEKEQIDDMCEILKQELSRL